MQNQQQEKHGPSMQLQNLQPLHKSISRNTDPDIESVDYQKKTYIISPRVQRIDKLGNLILKNQQQKHSITFRDQVMPKTKLYDIILVDNWKKYNIIEENKERTGCCASKSCSVF